LYSHRQKVIDASMQDRRSTNAIHLVRLIFLFLTTMRFSTLAILIYLNKADFPLTICQINMLYIKNWVHKPNS